MLSITFYNQFSNVLDDRILLQLNSIKTLKQIQVENLIKNEWNKFLSSNDTISLDSLQIAVPESAYNSSGIYDFTRFNKEGKTSIGLVSIDGNKTNLKIILHTLSNCVLKFVLEMCL